MKIVTRFLYILFRDCQASRSIQYGCAWTEDYLIGLHSQQKVASVYSVSLVWPYWIENEAW